MLSAPVTTLYCFNKILTISTTGLTTAWGFSFNLGKCKSSRFSRKPYTLGSHTLAVVPSPKDQGITVTNKLSWSPHISIIVAKAKRKLGFLRRHCSTYVGTNQKRLLYLTFVRSHLGYASEVWDVQSCASDLGLLERIQRRVTRAILGCSSDPNLRTSYKSRLLSLNLLPISYWLECRDWFFFYKSLHGAYSFPLNNFISFATGNTRSATNSESPPKTLPYFSF